MTIVYFIRHAEADLGVHDDLSRPLSAKGFADRKLVTEFLRGKGIDVVLSSPFKRALDTVSDFAEKANLSVETVDDFRERKTGAGWIENFKEFSARQWADFSYKLPGGESLAEVQKRNIEALNKILDLHKNKTIAIGTHGTALSTIINYYDSAWGYGDFLAMAGKMPWAVKIVFDGTGCLRMDKIDLVHPAKDGLFTKTGNTAGLARKTMARSEWKRILKREYFYRDIEDADFCGVVGLIKFIEVREPLEVVCLGEKIRILDNGFSWLQFAFTDKNYWLTVMFDEKGEIVEYYFDITFYNCIAPGGASWFFDLFLDVVVLKDGRIALLDEDELDEALNRGVINQGQYDLAHNAARSLIDESKSRGTELAAFCIKYYRELDAPRKQEPR